jgi:hypothetical protein
MNLSYNNFDYNLKHTLYAKAVVGKVLYAELDGVAKTSSGILTTLNKENPWYLFARNDGTNKNINGNFIGRIYRFKMKDNGVVVRDFRPCVHPKTFKACMYDLVTHKYFYNKYSTVFTPAPRFVEYIESTGTQYINLGYISPERAKTLRFVADMSIDTASGYRLCGSGSYNRQLYFGFSSSGTFAYGPGNVDAAVGGYGKVGIKYHYDYDALNGSYVVSENGTIVASKQFEFSGYTGANFYLFCYAGANEVPTALWSGKIYSFLVYENNALIQHLRPCLMGNTPCMYDMVEGKYYMNVGGGEFIAGGMNVYFDYTRIYAWINTENIWRPASDSCCFLIPLKVGKKYRIVWQNASTFIDDMQNTIFRYGQTNNPVPSNQVLTDCVRTTPQDTPVAEIAALNKYLIVQVGSKLGDKMAQYELFKVFEV